ncbi:MAG: 50S ribosomal protein L29 [Candidatus Moraniibacteriota bacterium]|nr:MAG: 50S ribosomal protein L29 [Candidatus Moranbacteria bacterium]
MKYHDIQQMSEVELRKAIEETRDALRGTRFALSVGKLKQNTQYGSLRKNLAKLMTQERERKDVVE